VSATWAQIAGGGGKDREKDDFYATPPLATQKLLKVEQFEGDIWEPACGMGHISTVLEDAGYCVLSTDLVDRGHGIGGIDFLLSSRDEHPNIITNPPFKLAQQFAERALEVTTQKVALLCRLQFLESLERKPFFESTPLKNVWVFSKRLTMVKGGEIKNQGGLIPFAWFVWEHGYTGKPTLGWI
jgi:hypothetical protein